VAAQLAASQEGFSSVSKYIFHLEINSKFVLNVSDFLILAFFPPALYC
jgi:hypothetical protein